MSTGRQARDLSSPFAKLPEFFELQEGFAKEKAGPKAADQFSGVRLMGMTRKLDFGSYGHGDRLAGVIGLAWD